MHSRRFSDADALCRFLGSEYASCYSKADALPQPFCLDRGRVRAIVLGTDPSNPDGTRLQHVFGLGGGDFRYFRSIWANLASIGLSLDELYVQNLCRNYSPHVTSENRSWSEIARLWVPILQEELDDLFDKRVPVLMTAWDIYPVLAVKPRPVRPSHFYEQIEFIDPIENHLGRTTAALFRHPEYSLDKWSRYSEALSSLLT